MMGFLDWVGQFLGLVGLVETALGLIVIVCGIVAWVRGIRPALIRLGNGLSKRKIAIFAKGDAFRSLESLLLDSN